MTDIANITNTYEFHITGADGGGWRGYTAENKYALWRLNEKDDYKCPWNHIDIDHANYDRCKNRLGKES